MRGASSLSPKLPPIQGGTGNDAKADAQKRDSVIRWVPESDDTGWLYQKVGALAGAVNKEYGFKVHGFVDNIQYGEYTGGGHYDWHLDIGRGKSSLRKISISIQLSDGADYDGGDLEFFTLKDSKPARDLVVDLEASHLRGESSRFSVCAAVEGVRFQSSDARDLTPETCHRG